MKKKFFIKKCSSRKIRAWNCSQLVDCNLTSWQWSSCKSRAFLVRDHFLFSHDLKVTSHFQRLKKSIFLLFELTGFKHFQNKRFLKSLKATEKFRKMYFQLKVKNRKVSWSPTWGIFAATAHLGANFSCYFHILFTSCTLKIHMWKLFAYEEIFAHAKI